ncbi:MAG: DUF6807 family protein [Melioribacteraceae bacterium]|nr:DUF6807 family protein [Melioribacteraceae bacterium]
MEKLYLIVILTAIFTINCSERDSDTIILSNIPEDFDFELPIEFNLNEKFKDSRILIAQSKLDQDINFILQKTPAIYSNKQNNYSSSLPLDVIEGEYFVKAVRNDSNFHFEENEKGKLTIFENENSVLTYNFGMQLAEGVPERYRRSSYIHPIFDLEGNELTDDFPSDHYHHRGLSLMWPKVFIDSVRYDLWHIYGQQGDLKGIHQVFENWTYKNAGPICAILGAKNYWQIEDGPIVMDELIDLRVFRSFDIYRIIDIKISLKSRTNISFEGQATKCYGGFNLRFAPRQETQITSKYGKEDDSDLKNLPWADLSAKYDGNDYFSGATIMQSENNPDFPTGWCLRHYGFLGVAWPGTTKYSMNAGESLTISYRVLIHQDNAEEAKIKEQYEIFNDPPEIKY